MWLATCFEIENQNKIVISCSLANWPRIHNCTQFRFTAFGKPKYLGNKTENEDFGLQRQCLKWDSKSFKPSNFANPFSFGRVRTKLAKKPSRIDMLQSQISQKQD